MVVCECAASEKLSLLSGSSSSCICPSVSKIVSSIGDGVFGVTGVSGLNISGKDKTTMFKTYCGPLPSHPRGYELLLGTCCSGDLSMALSRGEKQDARDKIQICKDAMRKGAMEFVAPPTNICAAAKQEFNIAERAAVYKAGDVGKIA